MSFLVVTTTLVWLLPIKICHAEYWNKPGVPGTGTCKWRWQVDFQGACGGTLIAPNWIISAAHCAKKKNMNTGKVGNDPGKVQNFNVKRWITHPKYKDPVGNAHNIALVEIDGAVKTNECVGFAMLPKTYVLPQRKTVITGRGKSSKLQAATVTTLSNDNCKKAPGKYGAYGDQITDDQLCAAGTDPTDQCQGDGGGPLLFEESDGNFTIHGVTSWGRGCEEGSNPGVWSRVYEHMDFLDEHLKGHPPSCEDTNNGKKDNDNDDCSWYTEFDPSGEECGVHDNSGFQAKKDVLPLRGRQTSTADTSSHAKPQSLQGRRKGGQG
jgi:trypsin